MLSPRTPLTPHAPHAPREKSLCLRVSVVYFPKYFDKNARSLAHESSFARA